MSLDNSLEGPYYLAGKEIESPLMNAAGSINGISEENIRTEISELARTAIGAIKIGSITIPKREGVGIWQFDEESQEMHNYMGLPNLGKDRALELISEFASTAHEKGKQMRVSVSPVDNPKFGNSIDQITELTYSFLETPVDVVEVNTSCPHQDSILDPKIPLLGYNIEAMQQLLETMNLDIGMDQHQRLAVKVPPELLPEYESWLGVKIPEYLRGQSENWLAKLAESLKSRKIFGTLVTSNTIPNQKEIDGHIASLSGPSERVKIISRKQLANWADGLDGTMEIVNSNGFSSGHEIPHLFMLGAVAVEGVSFLWRTDKKVIDKRSGERLMTLGERVTEILEDYAEVVELQNS